jgi:hypothetical protein
LTIPIAASFPPIENKKGAMFQRMQRRPNMHVVIHYIHDTAQCSVLWNYNVLAGEDEHR